MNQEEHHEFYEFQQNKMTQPISKLIYKKQQKSPSNHWQLQKMFRLYSPHNIICESYKNKQQKLHNEKKIIQLVFPNPNLLFIHPNKLTTHQQNKNMIQLNIVKQIVDRKGLKTSISNRFGQNEKYNTKPLTAPSKFSRSSNVISSNFKKQLQFNSNKQVKINFGPFLCEINTNDTFTSSFYPRRPKLFTQKCKKNHLHSNNHKQVNNSQNSDHIEDKSNLNRIADEANHNRNEKNQNRNEENSNLIGDKENKNYNRNEENENSFENIIINNPQYKSKPNTKKSFEAIQLKRYQINKKYEVDKLMREKHFKKQIVNSPKMNIYLKMQAKFGKYFK